MKVGKIKLVMSVLFVLAYSLLSWSVFAQFPGNGSEDPRDWRVYFIMIDRFSDGYSGNNNLYGDEFRTPNNDDEVALRYYNGGDFKGIIDNLDYIKSMGFNAIWITPVVKQPPGRYVNSGGNYDAAGYHGYWGYDFDSIDPHLESSGATFSNLIAVAHSKGMKVILDIVVNHGHGGDVNTSVQWYADRLKVKMNGQWWTYGTNVDPYYTNTNGVSGIWENSPGFFNYRGDYKLLDLLDFNECDPRTRQQLINLYKKFIDLGVDGFRIDTVAYMRKQWWGVFADAIWEYANSKGKPWFWQVGEAWVGTRGDALDYTRYSSNKAFSVLDLHGSCMDFPGQAKGVFAGGSGFEQMANIMSSDTMSGIIDPTFLGTFVDNHDKPRFPGGYYDSSSMITMWKNALNWYFLARGIPIVYYGTELEGTYDSINDYGAGEPKNRKFMGQGKINNVINNPGNYPIYNHLKLLNSIRENFISIRRGKQINISLSGDLAVFKREWATQIAYVLINKGGSTINYTLSLPNGTYTNVIPGTSSYSTTTVNVTSGSLTVSVPANSFRILVTYNDPTDTTRPVVTITSPANGEIIYSTNITINGTASDDKSGVNSVYVSVDGGAYSLASGTTSWNKSYTLSYGSHTVRVYAIDNSNNVSLTNQITLTNQSFTTNNITVYYYRPDWSSVNIHYNNGSGWTAVPGVAMTKYNSSWWVKTVAVVSNAWSFVFNNNAGTWDNNGGVNYNVSAGYTTIAVSNGVLITSFTPPSNSDTTPPTVSITSPANGSVITNNTNITVSGTASDTGSGVNSVYISVDGGAYSLASGTTSWNKSYTLSYGSHTVRVYAIDNSNNISTTNQVSFTLTNIVTSTNNITVYYYRPDWSSVNIHYNNGSGWTAVPGVAMTKYNSSWWVKTVAVVSNAWSFVFNNNAGTWDNNGGVNYNVSAGYTTIAVSNGVLITSFTPPPTNTTTSNWTVIKAVYDVGYGNTMYVRGNVSPLSWSSGKAMTWTSGNVWVWSNNTIPSGQAFEFKVLINDVTWSDGANFTGTGGQTITVYPTFNGNFYDTMDNISQNWTVSGYTGTGSWHNYNYTARAYYCTNESILTLKWNLSKVTNWNVVTLSYKFSIVGLDSGEYLKVDVYNGSSWVTVASYDGYNNKTINWTNVSINVSSYKNANFKVRFRTKMDSTSEYAYIDNVSVSVNN